MILGGKLYNTFFATFLSRALKSELPDGAARIFPNSYAAAGVRTQVSSVELHRDPEPLKDALPTELPHRGMI